MSWRFIAWSVMAICVALFLFYFCGPPRHTVLDISGKQPSFIHDKATEADSLHQLGDGYVLVDTDMLLAFLMTYNNWINAKKMLKDCKMGAK